MRSQAEPWNEIEHKNWMNKKRKNSIKVNSLPLTPQVWGEQEF